jgi:site-specific recombinase XerD
MRRHAKDRIILAGKGIYKMTKQPTSIRLSDLAKQQLEELVQGSGLNQSEVIGLAIARMHSELTTVTLTTDLARNGLVIVHKQNPEWGTWTMEEAKGCWMIKSDHGSRTLFESEFKFWRLSR